MQASTSRQVFRPHILLAASMGCCVAVWLAVLCYLLTFDGVPAATFASATFFVAFFAIALAYYARAAVFVEGDAVRWRGLWRTHRFTFDEVRNIDVLVGPIVVYSVLTPSRRLHFTSFFRHHRRLLDLLVARAGLSPQR